MGLFNEFVNSRKGVIILSIIWGLGLSALFIAGSAAFFSVFGLSKLFAGNTFKIKKLLYNNP